MGKKKNKGQKHAKHQPKQVEVTEPVAAKSSFLTNGGWKLFALNLVIMIGVVFYVNKQFYPLKKSLVDFTYDNANYEKSWQQLQGLMNLRKPKVAMVGNSMVGTNVNDNYFSDLTNVPTTKIENGASASAWWYLAVKNIVLRAQQKPEVIVLFFRDQWITEPDYRIYGEMHEHMIAVIADEQEPIVEERAYLRNMDREELFLSHELALYQNRTAYSSETKESVRKMANRKSGYNPKQGNGSFMKKAFDHKNLNEALLSARQQKAETTNDMEKFDFAGQINRSFLPPIIDLCRESNVELILVRVQRQRHIEKGSQPEHLVKYMDDLNTYLAEQKIPLVDFTHHEELTLEYYGKGDHMRVPSAENPINGQKKFTEILAKELGPYIEHLADQNYQRK